MILKQDIILGSIFCLIVIGVFWFFAFSIICDINKPIIKTHEEKLDIVRVFIHNPNEYSVLIKDKNKLISKNFNRAELFMDVLEGEPMYVEISYFKKKDENTIHHKEARIHIHCITELEGGGWQRQERKQTITGQTNVIE